MKTSKFSPRITIREQLIFLAIILFGAAYMGYNWVRIENERTNEILQIGRSIEVTLNKADINKLNAKAEDISKQEYQRIKNTLKSIVAVNTKARFAYLYLLRNGKIYFIADSEPEHSEDYSPPGQAYPEAHPIEYQPFYTNKAVVTDAASDRWGTWISVLVPIINKQSGKTTVIFGMDFNAKSWNKSVIFEVVQSSLLIFLVLILFLLYFKLKIKNHHLYNEINERKIAEKELIIAKEQAEESDKLKSAFLANMSHEIRTPMNGILGFAELLKQPELNAQTQQEYIKIIQSSGTRMLNIINDIVDISKIESGLMELNIAETNINQQMQYVYDFFKIEVEAKGMQISFKSTLTDEKALVKTDAEKVYAVLINLVKNAIKYSKEGSIEFGYSLINNNTQLQFYVKDTGLGISEEMQAAIFERFIQVNLTDRTNRQGAGLGLAISRAYIEMLGGNIWLESELGKGSTFYFTIPYICEAKPQKSTTKAQPMSDHPIIANNLIILITEDDETSAKLITMVVKKFAKETLRAKNGREAVDICKQRNDIDLILMDIQMPEMDGYTATRLIREFNKEIVIIAQTANALANDKEEAMALGFNEYMSKPIERNIIHGFINKYFGNRN